MDHSGNITNNETWLLSDSPHYITGDVIISNNSTLSIEAGCEILYCPITVQGQKNIIHVQDNSSLSFIGTYTNPITFKPNFTDDGIHSFFVNKILESSQASYNNFTIQYSTTSTSSVIYCSFEHLYTPICISSGLDIRLTLELKYCLIDECNFGFFVASSSKLVVKNSKLRANYISVMQNTPPYAFETGALIELEWCEINDLSTIGSQFPGTTLILNDCLLNDVCHPIITSLAGSKIIHNRCFIKANNVHSIPMVQGYTSSQAINFNGYTEIYDSHILAGGYKSSSQSILDIVPIQDIIQNNHEYGTVISKNNHYVGVNPMNRLALSCETGLNNLIQSDGDCIEGFSGGLEGNFDMTETPTGGDSSNDPPMFKGIIRINATKTKKFTNSIILPTINVMTEKKVEVSWQSGIPSKSAIMIRKKTQLNWTRIRLKQDWAGRIGGDEEDSKYKSGSGNFQNHLLVLDKLQQNTEYELKILCTTPQGVEFTNENILEFKTLAGQTIVSGEIIGEVVDDSQIIGEIEV